MSIQSIQDKVNDPIWMKKNSYIDKRNPSDPKINLDGMIALGHADGLCYTAPTIVALPSAENDYTATVIVTVQTSRGSFAATGTANPNNTPQPKKGVDFLPIVEMAESRALARALRFAVNSGLPTEADSGDDTDETSDEPPAGHLIDFSGWPPTDQQTSNAKPASSTQIQAIANLGKLVLEEPYDDTFLGQLTDPQARDLLADLNKQFQALPFEERRRRQHASR